MQVVHDIVHEDDDVVFVVAKTSQIRAVAFELLQRLVDLLEDVLCARLLKDQCFVEHLRVALPVLVEEFFQCLYMLGKLFAELIPVLFGNFLDVVGGLFELGAAEFDQAPARLDLLKDCLDHAWVHLVILLV